MAPVDALAVDAQQFLRDGYCVVRSCVPSGELPDLRAAVTRILDLKKRQPDFVPGSRISPEDLYMHADAGEGRTADANADADHLVRFCLGPTTLGVSDMLVNRGASGGSGGGGPMPRHWTGCIAISALVENEVKDNGATDWHRDASSSGQAPLGGMQADMQANGIAYTQWNICLEEHGDSIFWLVPASHRLPDSPELQQALLDDPCAAIPGGIPIELAAGDGSHWRDCHSAVPPSTFIRCFNIDKKGMSSK